MQVLVGLLVALFGCGQPEVADETVSFLRDGLIVSPAQASGEALAGDRSFHAMTWVAGEPTQTPIGVYTAPRVAECATVGSFELPGLAANGGLARLAAGAMPDPALAFSPDGRWVAVGDSRGGVYLLDGLTGARIAQQRYAGAVIKQVAFSVDSTALWVGEQSPEAALRRLSVPSLALEASLSLADYVERGALPAADDVYGVYSLPGVYALLPQGDGVIVAASHGWQVGDERRNRAQVLLVNAAGVVAARWPEEHAADAVIHAVAVDDARVAVALSRSASGPPPVGLPLPGVQLLARPGLAPAESIRFSVLAPWYEDAYVFDALALTAAGLVAGVADGRVIAHDRWSADVGTPIITANVPVAATLGGLVVVGDRAWVLAADSSVPYGATDALMQPPSPHPAANTVHGLALVDGARRGVWRADARAIGLARRPGAPELAVVTSGARNAAGDDGLVWLDVAGEQPLLRARCTLDGQMAGRVAVHADGRAAVVTMPRVSDAGVSGVWRVHIVR